jgi:predicted CoA-binding protein
LRGGEPALFLAPRRAYHTCMSTETDTRLKDILAATRTIALVGFSNKPDRPSYRVAEYLAGAGYRVIPVNPGLAGQDFGGETIVGDLSEIPAEVQVDMVDIFRRSEQVPAVVEAAIAALPHLQTVWVQLGITSETARSMAEGEGLAYVENRCTKIEHARLIG